MIVQILNAESIFIVVVLTIAMLVFLVMLIAIFITFRSENLDGKETRLEDGRKPAQSSKIKLPAIFHKVHAQTGTLDDPGSFTNHEHPVDATYGSAEPVRRNTQQPENLLAPEKHALGRSWNGWALQYAH